MKHKVIALGSAILFALLMIGAPAVVHAQPSSQEDDGIFVLGSVLLSVIHVPLKLATCVGTQTAGAVFYAGTFGVPGHYDGGTNGKDIGETARRSCTGNWFITPDHVKRDYGR